MMIMNGGVNDSMPASSPCTIKCAHQKQSLDPALLRPGRLSHVIEVTPPQTREERLAVLRIHTAKVYTLGCNWM